jgi:hypothetical protein
MLCLTFESCVRCIAEIRGDFLCRERLFATYAASEEPLP